MQVAQRGTSETGITSSKYAGAPDRFFIGLTTAGTWTAAQSTDAPAGFSSSYKLDCTVADSSLAAGDLLVFQQAIEAQNLQHLKKGTSSAESVTVSFHVKSNKTGTYIAELYDADNTRQISQAYTISSANTWEKKTLTYAGDTTGALNNDNGIGLYLVLWLAAGSGYSSGTLSTSWTTVTNTNRAVGVVNLADSTDNEWYITGVQLEVGEQATPFEHRSFADELRRCQRYYYQIVGNGAGSGFQKNLFNVSYYTAGYVQGALFVPTPMRTTPSISQTSGTGYFSISRAGAADTFDAWAGVDSYSHVNGIALFASSGLSGTAGHGGLAYSVNASAALALDAEL
jgi:hypothetical protein